MRKPEIWQARAVDEKSIAYIVQKVTVANFRAEGESESAKCDSSYE